MLTAFTEKVEEEDSGEKPALTELQLQLCSSHMRGYCLKAKGWRKSWNNWDFADHY